MCRQPDALSRTCYADVPAPILVSWGARAVYLGPSLGLSAHRNTVAVVAIGLGGPFELSRDPRDRTAGYRQCRSAVIWPNTLHHLRATKPMGFIYLDPLSREIESVRSRTSAQGPGVSFDVVGDQAIAAGLFAFSTGKTSWPETRNTCVDALGLSDTRRTDPRIVDAVERIRRQPAEVTTARDFARESSLSLSRFLHIFSDATGVPFRRYRLWCRLAAAIRAAHCGASLTDAAHTAGLASSAHFSSAFRGMFGLAPSDLNFQSLRYVEAI